MPPRVRSGDAAAAFASTRVATELLTQPPRAHHIRHSRHLVTRVRPVRGDGEQRGPLMAGSRARHGPRHVRALPSGRRAGTYAVAGRALRAAPSRLGADADAAVAGWRLRCIVRRPPGCVRESQSTGRATDGGDRVPKAGPRRPLQAVPRLALTREEAAASLGMSVSHFERNVQPTMRVVRSGQLVLVPISEVERWLQRNAHVVVDAVAGPQLVRERRR